MKSGTGSCKAGALLQFVDHIFKSLTVKKQNPLSLTAFLIMVWSVEAGGQHNDKDVNSS